MIIKKWGETRESYIMRVASAYIREHCPEMTINYDGTTCDGYCVADDLDSAREIMNNKLGFVED